MRQYRCGVCGVCGLGFKVVLYLFLSLPEGSHSEVVQVWGVWGGL